MGAVNREDAIYTVAGAAAGNETSAAVEVFAPGET